MRNIPHPKIWLGIILSFFFWFFSHSAFALDTKTLFKKFHNSVVMVMSFDANQQPCAIGSGFLVGDGQTVVTNYHVIENSFSVKLKFTSGKVVTVNTVLGVDVKHDIVLLSIPVRGQPLKLSKRTPEVGEDIVVIGNPKGLEGTLSKGIVSGVREEGESLYYQITAPISPGSSGGPIIGEEGGVLGVASFYVIGGQNLNFAMPSAYIHRLLRSPKKVTLREITREKTKSIKKTVDERVKIVGSVVSLFTVAASVFNNTDNAIKNVRLICIFYKIGDQRNKQPLHYNLINVKESIPPRLSIRFKRLDDLIDGSHSRPWKAIYRILDYDIVGQPGEIETIPTFK